MLAAGGNRPETATEIRSAGSICTCRSLGARRGLLLLLRCQLLALGCGWDSRACAPSVRQALFARSPRCMVENRVRKALFLSAKWQWLLPGSRDKGRGVGAHGPPAAQGGKLRRRLLLLALAQCTLQGTAQQGRAASPDAASSERRATTAECTALRHDRLVGVAASSVVKAPHAGQAERTPWRWLEWQSWGLLELTLWVAHPNLLQQTIHPIELRNI